MARLYDYLPSFVNIKGKSYKQHSPDAHLYTDREFEQERARLKKEGYRTIMVHVLSKKLRGVEDLHGKLYKPSRWIFKYRPSDPDEKYMVRRIYRDGSPADILHEDLTRKEAQEIVRDSPSNEEYMDVFDKM